MKTLIVFSSKYGTTESCAKKLASAIRGTAEVVDVKNESNKDLSTYDNIIIGGSIYVGTLNKNIKAFVENNEGLLKSKNVGLFLCCQDKQKALEEFMTLNFPAWTIEKAFVRGHLGHEIKLEAMNFFERGLLKHIMKVKESYSQIDEEAIARYAAEINRLEAVNG